MTSRPAPCRIVVCRGCCCGTPRRHPGVDHDGHLTMLRGTRDRTGRTVPVLLSSCLGPCAEGNIIVVHPSAEGRRRGARPIWLGFVNDDDAVGDLTEWISAGGPGLAPLPATLQLHRITASGTRTRA
jgi:(2Fe-2S) ferredoxin